MKRFRIGIDNYGLYPLELNPMELLQWARDNGAAGVAFSGLDEFERERIDDACLKDLAAFASENGMYIEWGNGQHIPRDMQSWKKKDIFPINDRAAHQAELLGTRIVRSCSGGLMRWNPESPTTEILLQETAEALKAQRSMLRSHNVILAIETHFEFTPRELLRLFDMCDAEPGDYLGICLDTMNLLTMLEDPVMATERILPWVVSTHIKDGAILLTPEGFVTFPVGIGTGVIDLTRIINLLSTLDHQINLSIEDHGGDFKLPIYNTTFLSEFPDLTTEELVRLLHLSQLSKQEVDEGRCGVIERERWREVCEERVRGDIKHLRALT